eukprot:2068439-Pleurochrysis_carterae.AAC.5
MQTAIVATQLASLCKSSAASATLMTALKAKNQTNKCVYKKNIGWHGVPKGMQAANFHVQFEVVGAGCASESGARQGCFPSGSK